MLDFNNMTIEEYVTPMVSKGILILILVISIISIAFLFASYHIKNSDVNFFAIFTVMLMVLVITIVVYRVGIFPFKNVVVKIEEPATCIEQVEGIIKRDNNYYFVDVLRKSEINNLDEQKLQKRIQRDFKELFKQKKL